MRRLFLGLVVAVTTVVSPMLANAGNQDTADQIASNLKAGTDLHQCKINVKVVKGNAWLNGYVADEDQLSEILGVVSKTDGVKKVINRLEVRDEEQASAEPKLTEQLADSSKKIGQAQKLDATAPSRVRQASAVSGQMIPMPPQPMHANQAPAAMMACRPNCAMPVAAAPCCPNGYGGPNAYAGSAPRYDQPHMPNHAWPSYAAYPNYAGVTYPRQYSPTAWPYIGPFYPYPQVPLGWRKVTLEWDDGWWMLDFHSKCHR